MRDWIVFDIEADGLDPSKVHCICLATNDGPIETYHDGPWHCDGSLDDGLRRLQGPEIKIAHNGQGYDYPVLDRLHPERKIEGQRFDSLTMARVRWPDEHLKQLDFDRIKKRIEFPGQFVGRHSLKAWGHRLGEYKDESPDDWSELTEDMAIYCGQDVEVLRTLVKMIEKKGWTQEAFELEHDFRAALMRQEENGFKLDIDACVDLERRLVGRRAELDSDLRERCGNFRKWRMTPKKHLLKLDTIVFNPGSRQQMAAKLQSMHGWVPKDYTPKGEVKMDEKTIGPIAHLYEEAALYLERLTVQKRIGQISEGKQAWLTVVDDDGRVRGRCNHNAAVSSRVTHSSPNMSAVPKVGKPYGEECRACWTVDPGNVLVGVDASGLEARVQAHFTLPFDGGSLRDLLLEGDIHTHNASVLSECCMRTVKRGKAKEFLYAMSYGGGDTKLGSILGGSRALGKRARAGVMAGLPGLAGLTVEVKKKSKAQGWLKTLDGRRLWSRSEHSAVNLIFQGAGAILMKKAVVIMTELLDFHVEPERWKLVAFSHDEVQIETAETCGDTVRHLAIEAIRLAGEHFNLRVPLDADGAIGKTWADTH